MAGCRGGLCRRRCSSLVSPLRCRPEILMTFFSLLLGFLLFALLFPICVCVCVHVVSLSFSIGAGVHQVSRLNTRAEQRQSNLDDSRSFERACTFIRVENLLRFVPPGSDRSAAQPEPLSSGETQLCVFKAFGSLTASTPSRKSTETSRRGYNAGIRQQDNKETAPCCRV